MRSAGIHGTLIRTLARASVVLLCATAFAGTGRVLYSFTGGRDGGVPSSALISDRAGNLYGTTSLGGAYGSGTAFKLTFSDGQWRETVIHSFGKGTDGALPQTSLTFDDAGNLYGTTAQGGTSGNCSPSGCGIVFELHPTKHGWHEIVLHNFTSGRDGSAPVAGMVFDRAGNLYGTTTLGGHFDQSGCFSGCGTVFRLTHTQKGWLHTLIYEFRNGLDGNDPEAAMIFDKHGNLIGTTLGGGNGNGCIQLGGCGTVFKLTPSAGGWRETVLYRFQGVNGDGAYPLAGVILDDDGNLFGTTTQGGMVAQQCGGISCGTFFELTHTESGWTEQVLYSFSGGSDGYTPLGTLVADKAGNLYGVTQQGGNSGCEGLGCGTVFRLSPTMTGWVKSGLYDFPGGDGGWSPLTALRWHRRHLYGTTFLGGTSKFYGVLFEVTP